MLITDLAFANLIHAWNLSGKQPPFHISSKVFPGLITSDNNIMKSILAAFPVGHTLCQKLIEGLGVVVVLEMAEFVHDHVLDAVDRCLNEVGVESDASFAVATPQRVRILRSLISGARKNGSVP